VRESARALRMLPKLRRADVHADRTAALPSMGLCWKRHRIDPGRIDCWRVVKEEEGQLWAKSAQRPRRSRCSNLKM
jgi:hypothetical protein